MTVCDRKLFYFHFFFLCSVTVIAEILRDLYFNVLSILQTKTRGKSVSISADYLLPMSKLKRDTVAEKSYVHMLNSLSPLRSECLCCCSRERKLGRSPSFPFLSYTENHHGNQFAYLFTSVLGICTPITPSWHMSCYTTPLKVLVLFFSLEGNSNTVEQTSMALQTDKPHFYFF